MRQGKGNQTFGSLSCRNLLKSQLGGVIFGCKHTTIKECLSKQIFGLPYNHFSYVRKIDIGLPLFLFNYSDRKLHGIFEAAGSGQLNIDPYGWTSNGSERTSYPAQVQIRVQLQCEPLTEEIFKPAIADNYFNPHHFWFELDHVQTNKLICLLASFAVAPRPSLHTTKSRPIFRVNSSSETKEDSSVVKVAALGPEVSMHVEPSMNELEDSLGEVADSGGKPDSLFTASILDIDNSISGNHSDAQNSEENDRDSEKLKDLTLGHEHGYVAQMEAVEHSNLVAYANLDRDTLQEQTCSEEKAEDRSSVPSHSWSVIDQLMHEMNELRALGAEQSTKICHLEEKLDEAEKKIQRLQMCCNMLESTPGSLNGKTSDTVSVISSLGDPMESMLLLGGYDGESWLSSVHSYFPSRNVVKAHNSMRSIRSYAAVAKLDGIIYMIGGGDSHKWYDTAESYDMSSDQWSTYLPLNEKKGCLGGAALNGKIFAIGGGNGVDSFADVEMLDPDIGRWIRTKSMQQKRFAVATAEHSHAIYAVGGFDGNEYLNTAERFDPREHSWTRIATMKSRRGCHSLVLLNEKLYAIGGFNGETMVSSVEIYDPRKGAWMAGDPMNHMRGYSAAAVVKDSIYVIGGLKDKEDDILDSVECFKEGEGWKHVVQTSIGRRCFLAAIAAK
ncbi:PREDICTED: influenza virus NS1A-binding protein homolog isoform X2 [Tarenaya hassleriana]|nr:PREDICTED: influenza virus NS1A-binding protein homolog isoform X2 [Tarenaya hassleriana]XP_019058391.1 PREDICTED: influenza virus NS1A-binding protein homolog isoform X2 [Tarenaya hassleriana]